MLGLDKITSDDAVSGILGWLGLGGIAAFIAGIVAKRLGKDDSSLLGFLAPDNPIRKGFDWCVNLFNSCIDSVTNWFRGTVVKEEVDAQKDVNARIDKAGSYADIDKFLGLSGAGEHIRAMTKDATQSFFGISMSTKPEDVLASAEALRVGVSSYLLDELKKKYPAKDPAKLKEAADEAAEFITGTREGNADPALLTTGYGGMMIKIQTAVKAAGDYTPGSLTDTAITPALLGKAKVALGI